MKALMAAGRGAPKSTGQHRWAVSMGRQSENIAFCFLFHVVCIWPQTCLLASVLILDSPTSLTRLFQCASS